MNRSVYVMDTLETCHSCLLADVNLKAVNIVCRATGELQDDTERGYEALKAGCPLRPLPVRITGNYYDFETYDSGVMHGHNHVLDEIGG